jgi:hypothetical protein
VGRRSLVWIVLGGALIPFLALIQVAVTDPLTIVDPRVHVRWHDGVSLATRTALERRHGLLNGAPVDTTTGTWRYDLVDTSRENIRTLIQDPAVDDTGYIDREALAPEGRAGRGTLWNPFRDLFDRPSDLLRLHRSLWLVLGGGLLLWASRAPSERRRRSLTVATLLFVGVMGAAVPFEPSFVTMGGSADHTRSREDFEHWFGGRVRFEKHLSGVILLKLYGQFEPTEAAPERTLIAMARGATAWFVVLALAIARLERWSALVLRYLGLVLLAPAALLYFGWREFGYLSLNVAAFPLLTRGLRGQSMRLEAAAVCGGLGAALHGSGLVSLAGTGIATLGAQGTLRERIARALRVTAWGTAAYLGWIALYMIVLKLPISFDPGPTVIDPWRPLFNHGIRAGRVAPAILSATGARDLLMSAWVVGAPLLVVALSLWRRHTNEVRTMMWYIPPSIFFLILRWPFDGVGGGMDLVVAGFPAMFALTWVCAHDRKTTSIAALLLASAHYAFWQVVLDERFLTK